MGGFNELGYNVNPEQQSLLKKINFSLRPLGTAGHLDIWRAVLLAFQPIVAFFFATLILVPRDFRYHYGPLDSLIHIVGCVLLLVYPAIAVGVLAWGIAATRVFSKVRWSAILYWMWWPVVTLVMCCLAVILGTSFGNYLWLHHFLPWQQVSRLQAYEHVNSSTAGGVRLQDAGIIAFDNATVDRFRTGCFKSGETYCAAPIVGSHDLFMVGVDCCSCPGEFRCGDWNKPEQQQLGGVRVVNEANREQYRQAAEDWASAYRVKLQRPIFLYWVADPFNQHDELLSRGYRYLTLGLLLGPCVALLLVVALNGVLGLLIDAKIAAPIKTPVPPGGLGRRFGARFLPNTLRQPSAESEEDSGPSDPKYVCL